MAVEPSSPRSRLSKNKLKPGRKIRFGLTDCSTYVTDGEFKYEAKIYPYKNPKKIVIDAARRAKSKVDHSDAFLKALQLEKKLGTSLDPIAQAKGLDQSDNETDSESECVPAVNKRKKWIADTGSGHDLIGQKYLGGSFRLKGGEEVEFLTSGGKSASDEYVDIKVSKIDETVKPLVMEHSPLYLQLVEGVWTLTMGFIWPPSGIPYFVRPDGVKVPLKVKNYIPYLYEDKPEDCVVASSSSSESLPKGKDEGTDGSKTLSVTDERYRLPDDEIPKLSDGAKNQIKMATSLSHLLTNYPKDNHCDACNKAKLRASPSHPTPAESKKDYKEFGDHVTCDLKAMFKDKNS